MTSEKEAAYGGAPEEELTEPRTPAYDLLHDPQSPSEAPQSPSERLGGYDRPMVAGNTQDALDRLRAQITRSLR